MTQNLFTLFPRALFFMNFRIACGSCIHLNSNNAVIGKGEIKEYFKVKVIAMCEDFHISGIYYANSIYCHV